MAVARVKWRATMGACLTLALILALAGPALAGQAPDLKGWNDVTWDMTPAQVDELYPTTGWQKDDPPRRTMREPINWANRLFTAIFQFDRRADEARLVKILIVHEDKGRDARPEDYVGLFQILLDKYGKYDERRDGEFNKQVHRTLNTAYLWYRPSGDLAYTTGFEVGREVTVYCRIVYRAKTKSDFR